MSIEPVAPVLRKPEDLGTRDMDLLFEPRSIAVVGASERLTGGGGLLLKSIMANNFRGKVYPINPNAPEVAGLKAYPRLADVPGEIDLAVIAIPAKAVPGSIRECRDKGVKFAVVHSSGFGESGVDGRRMEVEMAEIAAHGGPRIVGGNCMGIYCPASALNTIVTYLAFGHDPGPIAFVGQSGWGTEQYTVFGLEKGLRFSRVVSIGNQCDLSIEDFMEYFAADPQTRVITGYVEGLKRPREFLELAGRITRKKPVVLWKGGRNERSASASASHTGSLATNQTVFEAALKQTGVVTANGLANMLIVSLALSCPVLPKGNRVGLVVNSGGAGIALTDTMESTDLKMAAFPEGARQELREYLGTLTPIRPNVDNPVDVGWITTWGSSVPYFKCLEIVLNHCDMAVLMCFLPLDQAVMEGLKEIRDRFGKPIVVIPGHPLTQNDGMNLLSRNGIPSYSFPEEAIQGLAALWQYSKWKNNL